MHRVFMTLLVCAAAQAATLSVNISANATIPLTSIGGTSFSGSGTATLTGGIADTGTFNATVSIGASGNFTGPYTLALKNGNIGGTLTVPSSVLSGSGSGTMTVTSATGSYGGDTGTFNVTGTGSIGVSGIVLSFTGSGTITTGGTVTAPPPSISAVQDAGSYTPNIAPGSIFVVKGSNLSDSGYNPLSFPLPTTAGAGKTTITFTPAAGGAGTQAFLIYTYLQSGVNQLAAILPSTVTPGNYNVTVSFNGTASSAVPVTVVSSKFGIITQDSTGNGLAAAQVLPNYTLVRLTTGNAGGVAIQPAHPGDTVVVYGTGLGPSTTADNVAVTTTIAFQNVLVSLGGNTITPLFAGRTPGASGLDQIAFTIPANFTATGCAVPLQVTVGGTIKSVATTLSVADTASAAACTYPGLSLTQLQNLDQGGVYTTGGFDIEQITETTPTLGTVKSALGAGEFTQVTGFELGSASSSASFSTSAIGSCTVTQVTSSGTSTAAGGGATFLDAGIVTLTTPSGTTKFTNTSSIYSASLGQTLPAGQYSLSGAGGKDVGAFGPVSITLGTPLQVTGGLPAIINEAVPLTLQWTGGAANDVVEIIGSSSSTTGTGSNTVTTSTGFVCLTTAGPGTFTIQPSVLAQMQKTTNTSSNSSGFLSVLSTPTPASFTAPLIAGGSVTASFAALSGTAGQTTYQ